MQPGQEMVERPVGIVQTAGRILTEVVFDRTHGRLNSPASGSGSPVPRSRDLVSRATGLWPQAWPPVAGTRLRHPLPAAWGVALPPREDQPEGSCDRYILPHTSPECKAAAVSNERTVDLFTSHQEMQTYTSASMRCAVFPLRSARVDDGNANVRGAVAISRRRIVDTPIQK